jgi:hypothetical protein
MQTSFKQETPKEDFNNQSEPEITEATGYEKNLLSW